MPTVRESSPANARSAPSQVETRRRCCRSAQEQQGNAEHDPEVALEAPLDPAHAFSIGEAARLLATRRGDPSVDRLLERDPIDTLEGGPYPRSRDGAPAASSAR